MWHLNQGNRESHSYHKLIGKFSGNGTFIRRWISNSAGDEYHNYFDEFITEVTKNSGTYRIL